MIETDGLRELKDKFGLVLSKDPYYPFLKKLSTSFKPGRYTVEQIFKALAKRYRSSQMTNTEWYRVANLTLDGLIYWDLIKYEEGYYIKE